MKKHFNLHSQSLANSLGNEKPCWVRAQPGPTHSLKILDGKGVSRHHIGDPSLIFYLYMGKVFADSHTSFGDPTDSPWFHSSMLHPIQNFLGYATGGENWWGGKTLLMVEVPSASGKRMIPASFSKCKGKKVICNVSPV